MNINQIKQSLDDSILSAAEQAVQGQLFRNRKLSVADMVRLLIGAEGGSLNKILHDAGIEVTASAVSQRRAQIDPAVFRAVFEAFNAACEDKVNFKMAVVLCRESIRTPNADAGKLLRDIARYTVPIRPGRQGERNLPVKGFPGFVYRVAA